MDEKVGMEKLRGFMDGTRLYTIREVAELTSLPPHTIRFYEKEFAEQIHVSRTPGGHRLYDEEALQTLQTVLTLIREKGMTIKGARQALENSLTGQQAPAGNSRQPEEPSEETLVTTLLRICREKTAMAKVLRTFQRKKLSDSASSC